MFPSVVAELGVHVSDEELADLRRRLAWRRFIEAKPEADWRARVPVGVALTTQPIERVAGAIREFMRPLRE